MPGQRLKISGSVVLSPFRVSQMARPTPPFNKYLRISTVGLEMALSMGVAIVAGLVLDRFLGTAPWFILVCFLLGVAAAGWSLFRVVKRIQSDMHSGKNGKEDPSP